METKTIQLIFFLVVGFCLCVGFASQISYSVLQSQARITKEEASKIVLSKISSARIESIELEKEYGRLIWSFNISMANTKNITDVQVNAKTGKIICIQLESSSGE